MNVNGLETILSEGAKAAARAGKAEVSIADMFAEVLGAMAGAAHKVSEEESPRKPMYREEQELYGEARADQARHDYYTKREEQKRQAMDPANAWHLAPTTASVAYKVNEATALNDVIPVNWRSPTYAQQQHPLFEAIWRVIKNWDINVPDVYSGYCGATGNHVKVIMDAITGTYDAEKQYRASLVEQAVQQLYVELAMRRGLDLRETVDTLDTVRAIRRVLFGDEGEG